MIWLLYWAQVIDQYSRFLDGDAAKTSRPQWAARPRVPIRLITVDGVRVA